MTDMHQKLALFAMEAGLDGVGQIFAPDTTGKNLRHTLRQRYGMLTSEFSEILREKAETVFTAIRACLVADCSGTPELPAEYHRWERTAQRDGRDFFGHGKNTKAHRITLAIAGMRQFTIRRVMLKTELPKRNVVTWVRRKFKDGYLEREMKYGTYVYRLKPGLNLHPATPTARE